MEAPNTHLLNLWNRPSFLPAERERMARIRRQRLRNVKSTIDTGNNSHRGPSAYRSKVRRQSSGSGTSAGTAKQPKRSASHNVMRPKRRDHEDRPVSHERVYGGGGGRAAARRTSQQQRRQAAVGAQPQAHHAHRRAGAVAGGGGGGGGRRSADVVRSIYEGGARPRRSRGTAGGSSSAMAVRPPWRDSNHTEQRGSKKIAADRAVGRRRGSRDGGAQPPPPPHGAAGRSKSVAGTASTATGAAASRRQPVRRSRHRGSMSSNSDGDGEPRHQEHMQVQRRQPGAGVGLGDAAFLLEAEFTSALDLHTGPATPPEVGHSDSDSGAEPDVHSAAAEGQFLSGTPAKGMRASHSVTHLTLSRRASAASNEVAEAGDGAVQGRVLSSSQQSHGSSATPPQRRVDSTPGAAATGTPATVATEAVPTPSISPVLEPGDAKTPASAVLTARASEPRSEPPASIASSIGRRSTGEGLGLSGTMKAVVTARGVAEEETAQVEKMPDQPRSEPKRTPHKARVKKAAQASSGSGGSRGSGAARKRVTKIKRTPPVSVARTAVAGSGGSGSKGVARRRQGIGAKRKVVVPVPAPAPAAAALGVRRGSRASMGSHASGGSSGKRGGGGGARKARRKPGQPSIADLNAEKAAALALLAELEADAERAKARVEEEEDSDGKQDAAGGKEGSDDGDTAGGKEDSDDDGGGKHDDDDGNDEETQAAAHVPAVVQRKAAKTPEWRGVEAGAALPLPPHSNDTDPDELFASPPGTDVRPRVALAQPAASPSMRQVGVAPPRSPKVTAEALAAIGSGHPVLAHSPQHPSSSSPHRHRSSPVAVDIPSPTRPGATAAAGTLDSLGGYSMEFDPETTLRAAGGGVARDAFSPGGDNKAGAARTPSQQLVSASSPKSGHSSALRRRLFDANNAKAQASTGGGDAAVRMDVADWEGSGEVAPRPRFEPSGGVADVTELSAAYQSAAVGSGGGEGEEEYSEDDYTDEAF